jgi:hypothetical protein
MNYTELVSAITSYTENQFPTADMDTFITQAEQRIYNTIQFPSLRRNVTGTTTVSKPYLACPDDFLSVYSMAVFAPSSNEYSYLIDKDVNFIREAYPNPTSTGRPKYFALFGPSTNSSPVTTLNELTFILGPTPDASYYVELHYFYYPESITTVASGQTWLGDNFDSVLLYGALVEAYTFMKGETDMMQLYEGKYKEALALAKRLGDGLERQDAYRAGQYRQPVT